MSCCRTQESAEIWTGRRRSHRRWRLGSLAGFGDAAAVAVALEGDAVRVMDEAVDEGGGGGRVGEDGRPVAEGQIGRETLLLHGRYLLPRASCRPRFGLWSPEGYTAFSS